MALYTNIDSLFQTLGNPGRYHIVVYLMLCINYFPVVFHHLAMAFYGLKLGHHCEIPSGNMLNQSIPKIILKSGKTGYEKCMAYQNFSISTNNTIGCPNGWSYQLEKHETSIVSEFDLVCDNKDLPYIATTVYFIGVMLGGLVFGTLSDFFGRKKVVIFCMVAHVVIGSCLVFVKSYMAFILVRLLLGVVIQGLQISNFVLIMELFRKEHRSLAGLIIEIFWGLGVVLLAMIAYLARNWRYTQLALSLPFILLWLFIWFIPESPRWQLSKSTKGVVDFFLKVAKFNNIKLTEEELNFDGDTEKNQSIGKNFTVLDMVKTRKLRRRSLVVFYISMVTSIGYYGLLYSVTNLAGNKYLNFFIGGALELPGYVMTVWIVGRFGRRIPLCVYFVGGGLFCIASGVVSKFDVNIEYLGTALALAGRFLMACCFAVLPLFVSELYPTVIRNVGLGASYFWIRIGGVLFSPLLLLGDYTFTALPFILFGVMSIVGGVLTLLLPETLHIQMPDTIDDIEGIQPNEEVAMNESVHENGGKRNQNAT